MKRDMKNPVAIARIESKTDSSDEGVKWSMVNDQ
jgi:hypothetical protein